MQYFYDNLNPKLWMEDNKLKPEVSKKLKEIANAFIDFLEIPKDSIKDIVITGSSASYNYTPHSDIDLHLIIDFNKVHKNCPIVGEFLLSKKSEFNNNHDIFIYGIPVEVYAEATDNENIHNGLYSLKYNKWIDEPKKLKPLNNDVAVNVKYNEFLEASKNVADKDVADKLIQKIKKMRKAGLSKAGEFSVENLVFKKLRNAGIIGELMKVKKEGIDKELSLEESYENIIDMIEEMIGTSTVAMAPYATPVVGQENPSKYEKQSQGKSKKGMYNYKYQKVRRKSIVDSMYEIANYCSFIIDESKKLSDEERELLKKFQDIAPGKVAPETKDKYESAQKRIENYKKNMQDSDVTGKNILQGQVKREKEQNIKRYNAEASKNNPDLKKARKNAIWKFIRKKQESIGK